MAYYRYCVIEVKITEFDFPDLGQLAGYVAMVDDLLNTEVENCYRAADLQGEKCCAGSLCVIWNEPTNGNFRV